MKNYLLLIRNHSYPYYPPPAPPQEQKSHVGLIVAVVVVAAVAAVALGLVFSGAFQFGPSQDSFPSYNDYPAVTDTPYYPYYPEVTDTPYYPQTSTPSPDLTTPNDVTTPTPTPSSSAHSQMVLVQNPVISGLYTSDGTLVPNGGTTNQKYLTLKGSFVTTAQATPSPNPSHSQTSSGETRNFVLQNARIQLVQSSNGESFGQVGITQNGASSYLDSSQVSHNGGIASQGLMDDLLSNWLWDFSNTVTLAPGQNDFVISLSQMPNAQSEHYIVFYNGS